MKEENKIGEEKSDWVDVSMNILYVVICFMFIAALIITPIAFFFNHNLFETLKDCLAGIGYISLLFFLITKIRTPILD